jgi:ribosomal protein L11 methyltransferase
VADALLERGACSVDVSDAQAGSEQERAIFDEPDETRPAVWTLNRVSALFDAQSDYRHAVLAACEECGLHNVPEMAVAQVAEQDWVRASQEQFQPVRISERLWIVPSWRGWTKIYVRDNPCWTTAAAAVFSQSPRSAWALAL